MPVDFDRYMVGYAASAYLDDAFDRYATLFPDFVIVSPKSPRQRV